MASKSNICIQTKKNLNTTTGDCYVTINTNAIPAGFGVASPTSVFVMGLYDEYLTLKYSRITSLDLNSTLPLSE